MGEFQWFKSATSKLYWLGIAMLIPPSAMTMAPTIKLALSEARKATTSATRLSQAVVTILNQIYEVDFRDERNQYPVVVYPEGMGAVALDALIVSNP